MGACVNGKSGLKKSQLAKVPDEYLCPITQDILLEPVIASDGHTYQKKVVQKWFETHNTSPLTGAELSDKKLIINYALIKAINSYKQNISKIKKYDQDNRDFKQAAKLREQQLAEFQKRIMKNQSSKQTAQGKKLYTEDEDDDDVITPMSIMYEQPNKFKKFESEKESQDLKAKIALMTAQMQQMKQMMKQLSNQKQKSRIGAKQEISGNIKKEVLIHKQHSFEKQKLVIVSKEELAFIKLSHQNQWTPVQQWLQAGRKLSEMTMLRLEGNYTGKYDILKNYKGPNIIKMEGLNALPNLKILILYGNSIQKIENIQKLTELTHFYLTGNKIRKIENISHLNKLQKLYLDDNRIDKIENLIHLVALKQVYLFKNPAIIDAKREVVIEDLGTIKTLRNRGVLVQINPLKL